MALNFNTEPYFDDFDPERDFMRILFKPGYAVQARELTQSQTILQNQISNMADNLFSQNTPIKGGKVTTNLNCFYLKLNAQFSGVNVVASKFQNKILQNATGTILAKVIATAESTGIAGDPPTLILSYLSGPHFGDGTTIFPTDGTNISATTIGTVGGTTSSGSASVASISDGVFYIVNGYSNSTTQNSDGTFSTFTNGYFVTVAPQTIILDKYDNNPSFRVGLSITETVVDYIDDSSLLDPATGASNFQAPGADRYQINLTLITLPLTLGNDDQFIELLRIESGSIVKQVDGTVYSVIDDYFAKRDYETNGDYVVNDFKITPAANTSDSSLYNLVISKGLAYVRGYRIENQSDLVLTNQRARSTDSVSSDSVFIDYGNFFFVDTVSGTFDGTAMPSVDLHCVAANAVVSTNTTTYTSTLVGSAFLRDMIYVTDLGSSTVNSYIYKAYVNDINSVALSGKASTGTSNSITFSDSTGKFSGVSNAYYGVALSITGGTSAGDTRSIVSYNSTTKTATVDSNFTVIPDSSSNVTLYMSTHDVESIVRAIGTTISNTANINVIGKVNGIVAGDTVLESAGSPQMLFLVGYPYVSAVSNTVYTSTKVYKNQTITSNTLTLSTVGSLRFVGNGTLSASAVKQNFMIIDKSNGRLLDFSTTPNTISISGGTTATLTSSTYSGKTVDVIAQVTVSNGDNVNDGGVVLKAKNLILGNTTTSTVGSGSTIIATNTYVDASCTQVMILNAGISTNAKMSLYVTDVKRIRKIIDTKNTSITTNAGITPLLAQATNDITSLFTLDNGQKDSYYDHASISLIPGAPRPIGNIVIIFDFYQHTGGDGYFSVMSYLAPKSSSPEVYSSIPTYTAKDGTVYPLTDTLDFRPSRINAQTAYVWEYQYGNLMPTDLSQFNCSYGHYLGRDDKLVLTKDGNFLVIQGTSAVTPTFPAEPDGSLVLATLAHDPYTAFVPGEAPVGITPNLSVNKIQHKRWAKSDITDLQTRVNNLEYYTSLSLLEQNAQALQVPDANGLNRFKNGILVDDFSSYSAADTNNSDYAANLNIRTKQLSAQQVVNNFQLQNPIVLASLGTLLTTTSFAIHPINGTQTNIFTLPYTTISAVVQPLASSAVSVNPFSVTIQQGVAQLNPPMDNWVDNQQAPALLVNDPSLQIYQQALGLNVTNTGDFATLIGTSAVSTASSASSTNATGNSGTTTQNYSSQVAGITSAATNPGSSAFAINNGYMTNIAVLPYIRPQQIIVKVKGMLVNTPVSAWFDGQNVNANITTPNTIELSNISGTFAEDDIVGFFSSSIFYPVARVISIYNYPNGTNARLYVAKVIGAPSTVSTTTLQNALFDSSGNYIATTASGTCTAGVISIATSGTVASVGGSFTSVTNASANNFYKSPTNSTYCSFLNQYGTWGDTTQSAQYKTSFSFSAPTTDTYTIIASCDNSASVTLDGSNVLTVSGFTTTYSVTTSLVAGATHTIGWTATNTGGPAAFGLVIQDSVGNICFSSLNPPGLTFVGLGQQVAMPGGGYWYTGVTQLALDSHASSFAGAYVGSVLNITSKYVYTVSVASTYTAPIVTSPVAGAGVNGAGTTNPDLVYNQNGDFGYYTYSQGAVDTFVILTSGGSGTTQLSTDYTDNANFGGGGGQ